MSRNIFLNMLVDFLNVSKILEGSNLWLLFGWLVKNWCIISRSLLLQESVFCFCLCFHVHIQTLYLKTIARYKKIFWDKVQIFLCNSVHIMSVVVNFILIPLILGSFIFYRLNLNMGVSFFSSKAVLYFYTETYDYDISI